MGRKYTIEMVKTYLEDYNIDLMSTLWDKGVNSVVRLKCNDCNHEFEIKFCNFKYNPTCPKCRLNPKRTTYDEIKQFVEVESESGCKFLETEITYREKWILEPRMALCKLNFECKCGNPFKVDFNTFKGGNKRRCNKCTFDETGMGMRYTYEDIKRYIEAESGSNCKLLSKTYEGNHKALHLECSCGNDFYRALAEFKGESLFKCQECTGAPIHHTYEEVYNDLKEHNIKLLSTDYIGNNNNLDIQYNCGFIANRDYANIRKSKYKCPHCIKVGYGRDTEQLRREIDEITNHEYTLMSEYKTMNDKVLIRHNICHITYAVTPHNFLDSGNRCPFCTTSHNETYINNHFTKNNINFTPQFTYDDLIGLGGGLLKYDFAVFEDKEKTKLQYLLEYDGEFHYFPIISDKQLRYQQEHDRRKNVYCDDNNIILVRIPYWDQKNLIEILNKLIQTEGGF